MTGYGVAGLIGPGAFLAVVGASGVGKDSLIDATREAGLAVYPRRTVTRPAGPGEDHDPVTAEEFAAAADRGEFAVTWAAHGLRYGIPASVDDDVRAGRVVVANLSRQVLGVLAQRYERFLVVRVSVSEEVRAARLGSRGRESADEVARRLARADPAPDHPADVEIRNDGTLAEGAEQLLAAIRRAAGGALSEGSLQRNG